MQYPILTHGWILFFALFDSLSCILSCMNFVNQIYFLFQSLCDSIISELAAPIPGEISRIMFNGPDTRERLEREFELMKNLMRSNSYKCVSTTAIGSVGTGGDAGCSKNTSMGITDGE